MKSTPRRRPESRARILAGFLLAKSRVTIGPAEMIGGILSLAEKIGLYLFFVMVRNGSVTGARSTPPFSSKVNPGPYPPAETLVTLLGSMPFLVSNICTNRSEIDFGFV